MDINITTKEDDRIKTVLAQIAQIKKRLMDIEKNSRPLFNGECFLTDAETSLKLSISRRTLQEWRTNGLIGYIKLSGKILYRESDIQKLLKDSYRASFRVL